eukprot:4852774-Prymnesium_polylepis.1
MYCEHTTDKIEALARDRSESFGAVLGGHMSSQTTPSRPHATQMAYAQRRTTQAPPARAKIACCGSTFARAMRRHRWHTPVEHDRMGAH